YPMGNVILDGLTVTIKGGRYAIHQESRGSKAHLDYHATTIYRNICAEHFGNKAEDGYNSNWASVCAQANGTSAGSREIYINCTWKAPTVTPFYVHSNMDFDCGNELIIVNSKIIALGSYRVGQLDARFSDIGSGQK